MKIRPSLKGDFESALKVAQEAKNIGNSTKLASAIGLMSGALKTLNDMQECARKSGPEGDGDKCHGIVGTNQLLQTVIAVAKQAADLADKAVVCNDCYNKKLLKVINDAIGRSSSNS